MKCLSLGIVLLYAGCVSAASEPPRTKFTVHVTDVESRSPVSNAVIKTGFTLKYDPFGNEKDERVRIEEPVAVNGMASFEGRTIRNERGGVVSAEGYYAHRFGLKYKRNRVLNRWEPWDTMIEVKMRRIKNPVPMVYKRMLRKKVPVKQGKIGFDLEVADWVRPHGEGKESDFIFTLTPVTEPKQGLEYSLTFANPRDGIQEYMPPEDLRSSYVFPYDAPTNGYSASLKKYRMLYYPVIPNYPANNLKKDINYIFRVRTQTDDEGNIIFANYGRIRGEVVLSDTPLIDLQYWFNPEPNNRSLESDKKPH